MNQLLSSEHYGVSLNFLRDVRALGPALRQLNTARELAAFYVEQFAGDAERAAAYLRQRTAVLPGSAALYALTAQLLLTPNPDKTEDA